MEVFNPKDNLTNKAMYLIAGTFIGWHVIGSIPHGYDKIKTWSVEQAKFSGPDDPRWLKIHYITEDPSIIDYFVNKLHECGFKDVSVDMNNGQMYKSIYVDLKGFQEKDDIIEEYNPKLSKMIYSDNQKSAWLLPDDRREIENNLKELNANIDYIDPDVFYYILLVDETDHNNSCLIEVKKDTNLLSDITLASNSSSIIDNISTNLILDPAIYNTLYKNNIEIPFNRINPMTLVSDFREKFAGQAYNDAVYVLTKHIEVIKNIDPWDYDGEIETNIIDNMVNHPLEFIDDVNAVIDHLKMDNTTYYDEDIVIENKVKEKAEKILFRDTYLEEIDS